MAPREGQKPFHFLNTSDGKLFHATNFDDSEILSIHLFELWVAGAVGH